jgi:hypothetical protein
MMLAMAILIGMTEQANARAERLAAALRDNLKRRKAQARDGQTRDGAHPAPPAASVPDLTSSAPQPSVPPRSPA